MANDPLADMQNILGYQGLVGENPYLQYQGKIPMAGYYTGDAGNIPPTDAAGRPIQSFVDYNNNAQKQYQQALAAYNAQPAGGGTPGTTLNSTPGQIQGGSIYNSTTPDMSKGIYSAAPAGGYGLTMGQPYALSSFAAPGSYGNQNQADASGLAALMGMNPQRLNGLAPSAAAPAAAASSGRGPPPSPPDLRQAYLNALANPGPLPRYGAGPPQAGQTPTGTPPPNVSNAFLAANAGKSTPLINTLKQLQIGLG